MSIGRWCVSYKNGAAVRLQDVGDVVDSVEDIRTGGYANGKPAVLIIVSREPGANIIAAVDGIRALLPTLQASDPADDHAVGALGQNDDHSRLGPRRPGHDADLHRVS